MDRSRNRLKPGDRVRVVGYVHGDHQRGDVFEPVVVVEHLYKKGVAVKFEDGQSGVFDSYVLVAAG